MDFYFGLYTVVLEVWHNSSSDLTPTYDKKLFLNINFLVSTRKDDRNLFIILVSTTT